MKKSKLLLLGAVLASFSLSAVAQSAPDTPFNPNIYKNIQTTSSSGSRRFASFTLANEDGSSSQSFNVGQTTGENKPTWFDLTSSPAFSTTAGSTVKFSQLDWTGGWKHAYMYIDYNGDLGFNSRFNNTNKESLNSIANWEKALQPGPDGELVSFSCYDINQGISTTEVWYNSNGVRPTPDTQGNVHNPGITISSMPSFTIPSNLKPGTYRAFIKVDWNDINQHCTPVEDCNNYSDFFGHGGCAVLFNIEITAAPSDNPDTAFDASKYTSLTRTGSDGSRHLDRFTLENREGGKQINGTNSSKNVAQGTSNGAAIYADKTSDFIFYTAAGNTMYFKELTWAGGWKHAYLFIDYNRDGGFNSRLNSGNLPNVPEGYQDAFNTAFNPDETGELVSFTAYQIQNNPEAYIGYNDDGQIQVKVNGVDDAIGLYSINDKTMPEFTIPKHLKPGSYRALLKISYNDIDQHPTNTNSNELIQLGGYALLFTIVVEDHEPKVEWALGTEETHPYFTGATIYENAAQFTLNYNATNLGDNDELVVIATPVNTQTDAANTYTTQAVVPTVGEDGALWFRVDKNANSTDLVFRHDPENGTPNTGLTPETDYAYDVRVAAFTEDEEIATTPTLRLSFTTANEGSGTLGVEDVVEDDSNAPALYYNLQGIQVNQPAAGQIYIVRQGKSVQKVLVK